jgi:hypothetical protein
MPIPETVREEFPHLHVIDPGKALGIPLTPSTETSQSRYRGGVSSENLALASDPMRKICRLILRGLTENGCLAMPDPSDGPILLYLLKICLLPADGDCALAQTSHSSLCCLERRRPIPEARLLYAASAGECFSPAGAPFFPSGEPADRPGPFTRRSSGTGLQPDFKAKGRRSESGATSPPDRRRSAFQTSASAGATGRRSRRPQRRRSRAGFGAGHQTLRASSGSKPPENLPASRPAVRASEIKGSGRTSESAQRESAQSESAAQAARSFSWRASYALFPIRFPISRRDGEAHRLARPLPIRG